MQHCSVLLRVDLAADLARVVEHRLHVAAIFRAAPADDIKQTHTYAHFQSSGLCVSSGALYLAYAAPGETRALYSGEHVREGMLDVTRQRSAEDGCHMQTALNHPGEVEGKFCAEHAHERMVRPMHNGPAASCPSNTGARRTARRVHPGGRRRCIAGTGRCPPAKAPNANRCCACLGYSATLCLVQGLAPGAQLSKAAACRRQHRVVLTCPVRYNVTTTFASTLPS